MPAQSLLHLNSRVRWRLVTARRQVLRINLEEAAEQIGVTRSRLTNLGQGSGNGLTRAKVREWLGGEAK